MSLHTPRIKFPGFILLARLYQAMRHHKPTHPVTSDHRMKLISRTDQSWRISPADALPFQRTETARDYLPGYSACTATYAETSSPKLSRVPRSPRFSLFRPSMPTCVSSANANGQAEMFALPSKAEKSVGFSRLEMKVDLLRTLMGFSFWNVVPTCGSHRNRGASSHRTLIDLPKDCPLVVDHNLDAL
jgi:hypothetical protein